MVYYIVIVTRVGFRDEMEIIKYVQTEIFIHMTFYIRPGSRH